MLGPISADRRAELRVWLGLSREERRWYIEVATALGQLSDEVADDPARLRAAFSETWWTEQRRFLMTHPQIAALLRFQQWEEDQRGTA